MSAQADGAAQLVDQYERDGSPAVLDAAIELYRQVAEPDAEALDGLGRALLDRAGLGFRVADADAAYNAFAAALDRGLGRIRGLTHLGNAAVSRWGLTGDEADYRRGVTHYRDALALDPEHKPALAGLGRALAQYRSAGSGGPEDAEEALQLSRQALAPGDPDRLLSYAFAVLAVARERGDPELAEMAGHAVADAMAAPPEAGPRRWRRSVQAISLLGAVATVTGSPEQLRTAMTMGQDAMREIPRDLSHRHFLQAMLAMLYLADDQRDRGIDLLLEAVGGLPAAHPQRAQATGVLRRLLLERFDDTRNRTDIDWVIRSLEAELATAPSTELNRELLIARQSRVMATGDLTQLPGTTPDADPFSLVSALMVASLRGTGELSALIGAAESALSSLGTDAVARLPLVSALGSSYLARFQTAGAMADLERAIELARAATGLAAPGEIVHALQQADLARALTLRADATGSAADYDTAVDVMAEALRGSPTDAQERHLLQDAYAFVLHSRFRSRQDPADLDEAITAYQTAIGLTPPEHALRLVYEAGLGSALQSRFESRGDPADNQAAVTALTAAVTALPPEHRSHGEYYRVLGRALVLNYGRTGDPTILEQGISELRKAAASSPPAGIPCVLTELANALKLRAELSSSRADLEDAVEAGRQALAAAAGPGRLTAALGLADVLRSRSGRTGNLPDTDEAVRTIEGFPPDSGTRDLVLAVVLQQRFTLTGERADINKAVSLSRSATSPKWLAEQTLAGSLWLRSRHFDDLDDLDEAIAVQERMLATGYPDLAGYREIIENLHTKAGLLLDRFDARGRITDLDEAIATEQAALAALPPGHSFRVPLASGLSVLYARRYLETRQGSDLGAVLARNGEALRDADKALLPGLHNVHGSALRSRFVTTRKRADLDAAVKALQISVKTTPEGNPLLGTRALALAEALHARHQFTGQRRDVKAALAALRLAVDAPAGSPSSRLSAAEMYGHACIRTGRPGEALRAYRLAVQELLPVTVWRGLGRRSQESLLKEAVGLGAEAAAVALACDEPGLAVQLLDQARGVLWSQLLDLRTDRARLHAAHPELSDEFARVCTLLEHDQDLIPLTPQPGIDWRRQAADRFAELLSQIRAKPGFETFLRPPDLGTLLDAADGGLVAIINFDDLRCDAILVTSRGVRVLPLSWLTSKEVSQRAAAYQDAMSAAGAGISERINAGQTLHATLEWLWDLIVRPVLDAAGLRGKGQPEASRPGRVWWYGTGPLSTLPLHAAGHHRRRGEWTGDHIISSYVTTLRRLADLRSAQPSGGAALAVGLSVTPRGNDGGYPDLPAVPDELREVRRITAATILDGASATRAAVLDAIPRYYRVHFACHGRQDPQAPSLSHLALYDADLTVLDLARSISTEGDLAFLSACQTAHGDTALADEAIHLAAAFQASGYRHVIGTLWNVPDVTAPEVAAAVYERLRTDPDNVALALYEATRQLKQSADPLSWAPYVHLGP